jgi:peroxiredoxin
MAIEVGSTIPMTARVGYHGGGLGSWTVNDEVFQKYEIETCDAMFKDQRVVLFSLPGAFTPVCTSKQLPEFEAKFAELTAAGVQDVYCISVNDPYVIGAWEELMDIENVKLLADVDGTITESLGMMVDKTIDGMGKRSWRYAAVVNNGVVEQVFIEPGMVDNSEEDPYIASTPSAVLLWLKSTS